MNKIEAVNIMLLEKEVKQEELKAFPDNQHLKSYIEALDIICGIAIKNINRKKKEEKYMLKYRLDKNGVKRIIRNGKNKQVCIKLSLPMYEIIESYEGNSFSEKLHNLVFDMKYIYNS